MSDTTPPTASTTPTPDNWESLDEPIAWRPSDDYLQRSRLLRFMRRHDIGDYDALLRRASDDPAWFWDAVSADLGLVWQRPYTSVLDASRGPQWTRWFLDGQFNYVATALDQHAQGASATRTALIWEGEDGEVRTFSYAELQALTNQAANALRSLGVGKGDRVGIFMPMIP
ncbi:MAG TPA: acetyl-coenzyme A synthetase N-terminal domain-containing protein, partial [Ktedonobacterales bacterium]